VIVSDNVGGGALFTLVFALAGQAALSSLSLGARSTG